ncbi:hypothetical protein [Hydrogenophaga sp.]|uniref:hypothetical protein n=1 Tax=Hydrogenophaga sp. TaxID=1904254 RepID=UPI002FCBAB57
MVETTYKNAGLRDCLSNIYNATAALKAAAVERDSDVILSLQHAAEALPPYAEAAQVAGAFDAQTAAFVRIGCLADLIDEVNLDVDDQLLHAASVLLHLANEQLVVPEPA